MRILAAILLIIFGVAWPMASLLWLNARMNRQPSLTPRQIGLILTLNAILPFSLVLSAFGLLSASLQTSATFKGVVLVFWTATAVLFACLGWASVTAHSAETGEKG